LAVDVKNIVRLDLEDILEECIRQSYYAIRPYTAKEPEVYHPDDYAISGNEKQQVFEFAMDGASKLADYASMVKHHTQTGIDALTYYADYENPTEAASYDSNEETITTTEGSTEEPVANIIGEGHASGQKLNKGNDLVLFEISDLEGDQYRYTVVQQHIRTSLINYILHKWWSLVGLSDLANKYLEDFKASASDVRHNSASTHSVRNIVRKTRPSV
jgi:hypothetical protein